MTLGNVKKCSKCKQEKPLTEFFKNSLRKDGYNGWCKLCLKPAINRHKKSGKYREGQAVYSSKPEIRARLYEGKRRRRRENPVKAREQDRRAYLNSLVDNKRKARNAVGQAIKYRGFSRPDEFQCKYCPNQAQEYHHPSYLEEDWLKVEPVCKKCHAKIGKTEYVTS